MANKNIQSAEQIEIVSVRLEAPGRYFGGIEGKAIHLAGKAENLKTGSAVQFTYYENIYKPFLTAQLLILDQNDLISTANITGSEKIIIEYREPGSEFGIVSKTFIISAIEKQARTNETEVLASLELIEDFGYFNYMTSINKGYSGKGEEIIAKIHTSEVGKYILPEYSKESHQSEMTYIAPWVKPYRAAQTVLSKLTTSTGMPYFLYSTMNSNFNILTDLESIISRGAFNRNQPFTYAPNTAGKAYDQLINKSLLVEAYQENMMANSIAVASLGGSGSRLEVIDASTADLTIDGETFVDIKKEMDLLDEEVLGKNQKLVIIDYLTRILDTEQGNKPLNEYVSAVRSIINSSTTDKSVNIRRSEWVNGFNEVTDPGENKLQAIKAAILYHLNSNSVKIKVPGLLFSTNSLKTSVGNLIDFKIVNTNTDSTNQINEKKSGKFLILRKRHAIDLIDNLHTVSIEMTKVSDLDPSREV